MIETTLEKELLAVLHVAGVDVSRRSLLGVRIAPKFVEATNGHALVHRPRLKPDAAQTADIFVPVELAVKAAKLGPHSVPVVQVSNGGETVTVSSCGDAATVPCERDGAAWPDIEQVIKAATGQTIEVCLNPALLMAVVKALGWTGKDRTTIGVKLVIELDEAAAGAALDAPRRTTNPIRVHYTPAEGAVALLMPIKF